MHSWNPIRSRLTRFATAAALVLPAAIAQHIETSKFNAGPPRPVDDPAVVARGEKLYTAHCQSCHATDLRGGTGPNILRSQAALTDQKGENLIPIILGQDKSFPNHMFALKTDESAATAAYIRSIISQIGSQGRPPGDGQHPLDIVVGDAARGKQYFAAKCATCHSAEGDLKGFATKISTPKSLQPAWLRGNHFGVPLPPVKATVTAVGAKPLEGTVIHIDDFLLTLQLPDGTIRTIRRNGDVPKVVVKDPLEAHRNLLPVYTDGDIHDVTAYLVTLK